MKRLLLVSIFLLVVLYGCQSIHVGGTGRVGTVTGGGSVNIPLPKVENR